MLDIVGWELSGGDLEYLHHILLRHFPTGKDLIFEVLKLVPVVGTVVDVIEALDTVSGKNGAYEDLIQITDAAYSQTKDLDEEGFGKWKEHHATDVNNLYNATSISINTPDDFLSIREKLLNLSYNAVNINNVLMMAHHLTYDTNYTLNRFLHAHISTTYHTWINSMFYGDSGWTNNPYSEELTFKTTITSRGTGKVFHYDHYSIGNSCFQNIKAPGAMNIPETVVTVGHYAFSSCHNLTEITIPDSVTSIGDSAFSWNEITQIAIPDSITTLSYAAFYGVPD